MSKEALSHPAIAIPHTNTNERKQLLTILLLSAAFPLPSAPSAKPYIFQIRASKANDFTSF